MLTLRIPEPLCFNDRDALDIDDIIRFIRRYRRLCLIWTCVALCAGVVFILLSPKYYTAYTTILLEDRNSRAVADPAGVIGIDATYADNQVQVLQSDEVLGSVVDQNHLVTDPEGGGPIISLYRLIVNYIKGGTAIGSTPRYATIIRVKSALIVRRVGTTNVVDIGFIAQSPDRAAAIANAIAKSYIDGQHELKQKARADAAAYVWEQLAEIRDKAFSIDQRALYPLITTPESTDQTRARFRELQNNGDMYRNLYNSFLQRAYLDYDQLLSSVGGARVLTPAEPPLERSWPRPILVFLIAATAGAAVGIIHALLKHAADRCVRVIEDVHWLTSLNRIATVPAAERRTWKAADEVLCAGKDPPEFSCSLGEQLSRLSARTIGLQTRSPATRHFSWRTAFTRHRRWLSRSPWCSMARDDFIRGGLQEAYMRCSTSLEDAMGKILVRLHAEQSHCSKLIIAVAAPTRGAGVSSIAAHLARIVTKSGQKTLLIDANWRRPAVSQATPTAAPPEKIAGTLAAVESEPQRLDVLVLRTVAPISELNAAASIASTLQLANYPYVIVDFHATEQTADLECCMTHINKLIVVAESGRTSWKSLHAFAQAVPRDKIAAVVLNKVEPRLI